MQESKKISKLKKNNSTKGFTLIEILTALAMIIILSAIVISVYKSYIKKTALSTLKIDTRNCVTCVASEMARAALTGDNLNFANCTSSKSKYTENCNISLSSDNETGTCQCSGSGIISGITCKLSTNSTNFEGNNCE